MSALFGPWHLERRLYGPVVKAFHSTAGGRGSNDRCCKHCYSNGQPATWLPLSGQCWDWLVLCQSIITESTSLVCDFYLSVFNRLSRYIPRYGWYFATNNVPFPCLSVKNGNFELTSLSPVKIQFLPELAHSSSRKFHGLPVSFIG